MPWSECCIGYLFQSIVTAFDSRAHCYLTFGTTCHFDQFEAIVSLGMANSRMKDYFDLWVLLRNATLDSAILEQAVQATFKRRGTALLTDTPVGLSNQFSLDKSRVDLWDAFVGRNKLKAESLPDTVTYLRERFVLILK